MFFLVGERWGSDPEPGPNDLNSSPERRLRDHAPDQPGERAHAYFPFAVPSAGGCILISFIWRFHT